jgi:hypothetical protein
MKSKLLAAIALVLIPTFAFVEAAGAAGATGGASTGATGPGGTAATGMGSAGNAPGTAGTSTGATGTATGNGSGNSAEITSSMLPEVPSVVYSGQLTVGGTLPGTITFYAVPNYSAYNYTIINNERVLVDANTHHILRVIP